MEDIDKEQIKNYINQKNKLKNFQSKSTDVIQTNLENKTFKPSNNKLINDVQSIKFSNKNDLSKLNLNQTLDYNSLKNNSIDITVKNKIFINKYLISPSNKINLESTLRNNNSLVISGKNSNLNNIKLENTTDNDNLTNNYQNGDGKIIFFNSEDFHELKKKLETEKNIIEEYENSLILLLNILAKTKYIDYIGCIELVNISI